jgi:hypothetical protein
LNTYRYVFACKCPSDDETIIYGLEVRSKEMIRVEAIKDACAEWTTGFQEAIAADLRDVLGAAISLRAQHQGVEILTELDAPARAQDMTQHFPEGTGMWQQHGKA